MNGNEDGQTVTVPKVDEPYWELSCVTCNETIILKLSDLPERLQRKHKKVISGDLIGGAFDDMVWDHIDRELRYARCDVCKLESLADPGKKMGVLVIETSKDDKGYIPVVVKEGESGYYPLGWNWGPDKEEAQKIAEKFNEQLGITEEEVLQLQLDSMFPGR